MKTIFFCLLCFCATLLGAQPVQFWRHHNIVYTQTTDGTNDYYVGIDGTNGFSITPFQGVSNMTFNVLINFPSIINAASSVKRIVEISDAARTNIFGIDLGNFTGGLTNEYIGVFTSIGGVVRASGVTDGGSISAGWHMISVRVNPSAVVITIDGVNKTITDNGTGRPVTISTGYTATRLALMGTTAGGVPFGCTWREAVFMNSGFTSAQMADMYNYYTDDVNTAIVESNRSLWKYFGAPGSRSQILGFYQGNESGSDLLDRVNTARDLTKTNF
jgi:hypothetical protein